MLGDDETGGDDEEGLSTRQHVLGDDETGGFRQDQAVSGTSCTVGKGSVETGWWLREAQAW